MTERLLARNGLKRPLVGRYELQHSIGEGGQATVWQAMDIVDQSPVAIKLFRSPSADNFVRIQKEAEAQYSLRHHPHIVPSLAFGVARVKEKGYQVKRTIQEHALIAMLLTNGEPLHHRIRDGLLPPSEIVKISTEVASAAEFAHRHGVLHRDIKPSNILGHDGKNLLGDFGNVATITSDLTSPATKIGTPLYVSPEQIAGSAKHPTMDVYSLGMVLHEMLAGEHPFTDSNERIIIFSQIKRTVPLVEHFPSFWERSLQEQLMVDSLQEASVKATAKDPLHRHQSMDEFADHVNTLYGRQTAKPETVRIDLYTSKTGETSLKLDDLPNWVDPASIPYDDSDTIPVLRKPKGVSRRALLTAGLTAVVAGSGILAKETVFAADGLSVKNLEPPLKKKELEPKSRDVVVRIVQPLVNLLGEFDPYSISFGSALASFSPKEAEGVRQTLIQRDPRQYSGALDIAASIASYSPDFVNGLLHQAIKDSDGEAVGALGLAVSPYKPQEALLAKRVCDDLEEKEYSVALVSALDPTNLHKAQDAVSAINWKKARRLLVAIAEKQPNFAGYQFVEMLHEECDRDGRMLLADALRSKNPEPLLQAMRESVDNQNNYWQAMELGFRLARSYPEEVKQYAKEMSSHASEGIDYGAMLALSLAPGNLPYARNILSKQPIMSNWLRVIEYPDDTKTKESAIDTVIGIDTNRSSWAYGLAMATLYGYKQCSV